MCAWRPPAMVLLLAVCLCQRAARGHDTPGDDLNRTITLAPAEYPDPARGQSESGYKVNPYIVGSVVTAAMVLVVCATALGQAFCDKPEEERARDAADAEAAPRSHAFTTSRRSQSLAAVLAAQGGEGAAAPSAAASANRANPIDDVFSSGKRPTPPPGGNASDAPSDFAPWHRPRT